MTEPLGNLANDFDAYHVDSWGVVWVRSCGLYSGGATSGHWFQVGDVSESDVLAAIDAEIGLRSVHRSYLCE
jgi:hypothetical protein